jgi:hypothetical protein
MSTVRANAIVDAAGGNTTTINGMTPVGTDAVQTLTNKSIAGSQLTGSVAASLLTGALPAISGAALTGLPAPTTAQVGAATAALAVGDVGSYAWLTYQTASGAVAVGTTFSGANLRYHGVVVVNADGGGSCGVWGGAPSGTWRCMGSNGANGGRYPTNIYLRIS